ncbi:MAG TPA: hypothetical protein VGC87_08555 [Pyrinomonadaceae bacterium]|jgi:hypothetical protein
MDRYPITEFRLASTTQDELPCDQNAWDDIPGLALSFGEHESGNFLVTLTIPSTWNDQATADGTYFQLVLRTPSDDDQTFGRGSSPTPVAGQLATFSLTCYAEISPAAGGSSIVPQWLAAGGGTARIDGLCSLSAVGTAAITKVPFNDTHHWENTELFSRGLRLSNFSEILFITGYGPADVGGKPGQQTNNVAYPNEPAPQMQWIVDHLDAFFATIPYADGSGFYSKYDIVYFDLVVDSKVQDDQQQAVLEILEQWFGPEKGQISVYPKPATGILKKVEGLAIPGMMVEIEFTLAH